MGRARLGVLWLIAAATSAFVAPAVRRAPSPPRWCAADPAAESSDDVNVLMTALNAAVAREDFRAAAAWQKRLDAVRGGDAEARGDWAAHGAPQWLQRRLADLGMRFPTPIQVAALERAFRGDGDAVVAAPTGSGKTLAYLVPLLGAVEPALRAREAAQVAAGVHR